MSCLFYYSLYEIKLIHDYMMHNNIIHTQKASLVSALKSIHKTWCCKKIKLIKKCDWKTVVPVNGVKAHYHQSHHWWCQEETLAVEIHILELMAVWVY